MGPRQTASPVHPRTTELYREIPVPATVDNLTTALRPARVGK